MLSSHAHFTAVCASDFTCPVGGVLPWARCGASLTKGVFENRSGGPTSTTGWRQRRGACSRLPEAEGVRRLCHALHRVVVALFEGGRCERVDGQAAEGCLQRALVHLGGARRGETTRQSIRSPISSAAFRRILVSSLGSEQFCFANASFLCRSDYWACFAKWRLKAEG